MRFIILLLTIIGGRFVLAQAQMPFIRDIALNEANTPVTVNALLQDHCGYLWLGTDKGLYRYNGTHFIRLAATGKSVTALKLVQDKLWIGFKDGTVGFLENRQVKKLKLKTKIPGSKILDINASGNILWLSTEEGIFRIRKDSGTVWNTHSGLSDNYIYTTCLAGSKHIIAGSDHGINDLEWEKGKLHIKTYTTKNGLPDNIVRVIKKIPGNSLYWIGMQQGGIALYSSVQQKIINIPETDSWRYGQVNDILPLSATAAWIVTEKGYLISARLNPDLSVTLHPFYYPEMQFKKLLNDHSGNLWAATAKGISMITAEYLRYFKLDPPYSLKKVTAMSCDRENNLWLAQNQNLYRLTLKNGTPALKLMHHANTVISCLYSDHENRLWIGTMGDGLWYRDEKGMFINCKGTEAISSGNILSIAGTPDRLWVAALTGVDELYYPDRTQHSLQLVRHHNKQSGIGSDYIYFLFPDHKGRIWMATDGAGICMFDGKTYHHYIDSSNKVVYSITEDQHGNIWAAAYYKGLYHFNPEQPGNVIHEEVSDANISGVAINASGQLFAVYERCIDAWYPNSGQFRHFNYRLGIDSTSPVLNCIAKDTFGNLYIPFEDGVLLFKNQSHASDIRAQVHIRSISSLSKEDTFSDKKQFDYNENYLIVNFEGINFTNPERLRYRYRLKGYDKEWINTNDESITLPNLPPGTYTFQVQASLDDHFKNACQDQYTFSIKAPLWDKTWFIICLIFLLLLITYLLIKQRNKKQQELTQLQQERMNFEYEYLKSQVNPHFLFNSLNTLTNLIEENSDAAVTYTERLSDLYKNMISFRNKDLVFLKEEWEILSNYLFIQKSRFGAALQVHAAIPENLMSSKKIIPMALQMLVENAIKHNVVSLTQPLVIHIEADEEELTVRNGLNPKLSKEKGSGLTLINIRKRYSLLTKRPVHFGTYDKEYIVNLPLL